MWTAILTVLIPAIGKLSLMLLDYWVKYQDTDTRLLSSYYEFIKSIEDRNLLKSTTLDRAEKVRKDIVKRIMDKNGKKTPTEK